MLGYYFLLNRYVPGVINRVPIIKTGTLTPEPNKGKVTIELKPGFIEILTLGLQDKGTHVGADVELSLVPLLKTGFSKIASDKASARMLKYEFNGNQIGHFRLDNYDMIEGIYTITLDFGGGNLPTENPYNINITYPRESDLTDPVALENYGSPVDYTLEGYVYEVDWEKAAEAEVEKIARGVIRSLRELFPW